MLPNVEVALSNFVTLSFIHIFILHTSTLTLLIYVHLNYYLVYRKLSYSESSHSKFILFPNSKAQLNELIIRIPSQFNWQNPAPGGLFSMLWASFLEGGSCCFVFIFGFFFFCVVIFSLSFAHFFHHIHNGMIVHWYNAHFEAGSSVLTAEGKKTQRTYYFMID